MSQNNSGSHTTNHGDRNIDKHFDQNQFNKKFENNDNINSKLLLNHKSKKIINDICELLYEIFNKILNLENPIPYIFESSDKIFTFSIMLILLGLLLLLLNYYSNNIYKNIINH